MTPREETLGSETNQGREEAESGWKEWREGRIETWKGAETMAASIAIS